MHPLLPMGARSHVNSPVFQATCGLPRFGTVSLRMVAGASSGSVPRLYAPHAAPLDELALPYAIESCLANPI